MCVRVFDQIAQQISHQLMFKIHWYPTNLHHMLLWLILQYHHRDTKDWTGGLWLDHLQQNVRLREIVSWNKVASSMHYCSVMAVYYHMLCGSCMVAILTNGRGLIFKWALLKIHTTYSIAYHRHNPRSNYYNAVSMSRLNRECIVCWDWSRPN